MIELPSIKDSLDSLFYYLSRFYDEKRFPDFKGIYQFVLKDSSESYCYYIEIGGAKAESYKGIHKAPDIEVTAFVNDFFNILNGKLNPLLGYVLGKFKVKGHWSYLLPMGRLFGKQFDEKIIKEMKSADEPDKSGKKKWSRPNSVLVINASPRCKDGFTYFYLKHLLKGIENAGSKVELIDICDPAIKVNSCLGCYACLKITPGKCAIKDDANWLVDKLDKAEFIVFAFPVHFGAFPDKLKALLDRCLVLFLPYFVPNKDLTKHVRYNRKKQNMVIFSNAFFPEIKQFKGCVEAFELVGAHSYIKPLAYILRPSAESLAFSITHRDRLYDVLNSLESAGKQMMEEGRISLALLRKISKIDISKRRLCNLMNQFVYLNYRKHD